MTFSTKLMDQLGLKLPIVLAPMGGVAGPELAAAVSNAGGLGLMPIWYMPGDQAERELETLSRATNAPFGVNLNVAFGPEAHIELALAQSVRVMHFFWGDAAPYIERAKSGGATVMVTVGSSADARRARDAGADILVAQGLEAGGHVWGRVGLHTLVPMVVDAGGGLPVVAAGGIADGRSLSSAFLLGASGAMVGTALIVADEADAHAAYKSAILKASDSDTAYGTVFDAGWPDAPCRVLRNSTIDTWEKAGSPPRGKRPGEDEIMAYDAAKLPIARYNIMPPNRKMDGNIEAMALYAGQGVGLVNKTGPAATILSNLVDDAEALLRRGPDAIK